MVEARLSDNKKRMGRPPTGIGTMIGVRLQPDQLAALDHWIDQQPDPKPTRPEAVRRILVGVTGAQPSTVVPHPVTATGLHKRWKPD
jgi:hypothetical protein